MRAARRVQLAVARSRHRVSEAQALREELVLAASVSSAATLSRGLTWMACRPLVCFSYSSMSKWLALKKLLFGEVGRNRTVTQVLLPGARARACREPLCFCSGCAGGGSISKIGNPINWYSNSPACNGNTETIGVTCVQVKKCQAGINAHLVYRAKADEFFFFPSDCAFILKAAVGVCCVKLHRHSIEEARHFAWEYIHGLHSEAQESCIAQCTP